MADQRFFSRSGPFTLEELAQKAGCELDAKADKSLSITDVAPLDQAGVGEISFFDNVRYREQFGQSKAAACIIRPDDAQHAPANMNLLLTPNPYKAYALTARAFYPDDRPQAQIAQAAHVAADAKVGAGAVIEVGAVIGSGAELGADCWIEANAVIGANVKLGDGCRVGANASLSHCVIGNNVRLYPGCRIGQDGFGFAIDPKGYVKVPQLGRVIIEDGVEIGANTTIDRGAGPDTVIGQGTWIDNLVQIGHNVKIGKGCIIVAQAGISGSTVLEDYVMLGGQVGIAGHLRIGKGARLAAQSGIMRDVPPGQEYMGSPALPLRQFMRQIAMLNRLTKKGKD